MKFNVLFGTRNKTYRILPKFLTYKEKSIKHHYQLKIFFDKEHSANENSKT